MSPVVFLGPTLPESEAREILDARFMPPARMGDIYDVVASGGATVIGLIDGYFDSVPAVWHKEILFALSRGVRVVGASSMGALRAAELSTLGMEGVGQVFEAFRSGELEDDDEVAVAHGEADTGYRTVSEAMVNLRAGLSRAHRRGLIAQSTHDALVVIAKRRFYPERTWKGVVRDGTAERLPVGELRALLAFVDAERPNAKREDARALLEHLRASPAKAPLAPSPDFCATVFWERLTKSERRARRGAGVVRDEDLRRFVKATDRDLPALQREALLGHLVEKELDALGFELTQDHFDAAVRTFRLRHELTSADAMRTWLERAGLSVEQFRAAMHAEARCAALLGVHRAEVDARLLDALALTGRLDQAVARAVSVGARPNAKELGVDEPSREALEVFYRSRIRQFTGSLTAHARALGFSSAAELLDEVRKVYDADHERRGPSGSAQPRTTSESRSS